MNIFVEHVFQEASQLTATFVHEWNRNDSSAAILCFVLPTPTNCKSSKCPQARRRDTAAANTDQCSTKCVESLRGVNTQKHSGKARACPYHGAFGGP